MPPDAPIATCISPSSEFVYKDIFKPRRKWNHLKATIKGTSVTSILYDAEKGANYCCHRGIFTPTAMAVQDHKRTTILSTNYSLWPSLKSQEILHVTYSKRLKSIGGTSKIFHINYRKVQVKSVNVMKRNVQWTQRTTFPPSQQCKGVFVLFWGDYFFLNCLPLAKILYHKLNYISREYQA